MGLNIHANACEPAWTHTLGRGGRPLFGDGGPAFPGPEWLLTDGAGGYAMGTASGCRARRYHALRVLALDPPLARAALLAEVLEAVVTPAGEVVELTTCAFEAAGGERVLAPSGWERLVRFERAPGAVRWSFDLGGGGALTRTLRLVGGGAELAYRLRGVDPAGWSLRLSPMLAWRDHHAVKREADGPPGCEAAGGGEALRVEGEVHGRSVVGEFRLPGGRFAPGGDWWRRVRLATEAERGQEDAEDLYVPGRFEADLSEERVLRLGTPGGAPGAETRPAGPARGVTGDPLAPAAGDFLVRRDAGGESLSSVIAGYPWFADWGRDAFIALPGLLLTDAGSGVDGRGVARAAGVLRSFAGALRGGLVPNRFSDAGDAEYNTLDGSMWFVHAALAWAEAVTAAGAGLLPGWWREAVAAVLDAHLAGTVADGHRGERIPVGVGADGLICAGGDATQLTWMDAACPTPAHPEGEVFTPRGGRPVEVNALWVSNLAGVAAALPGGGRYADAAARAAASFRRVFWSDRLGRLLDCVPAGGRGDETLRPNMLIASSLERSPLSPAERGAVVAAARDGGLVTPVGLRTLPPGDPDYHPRMTGPPHERDAAYHRGTVWPWLIGPYAESVLRAGGFSAGARREAAAALAPLRAYAASGDAACLGQLPETFDAEPGEGGRWVPRGCPAQAWSVAEVRRVSALLAR